MEDASGNSGCRDPRRNVAGNNRASTNGSASANSDAAQDYGAGSDISATTDAHGPLDPRTGYRVSDVGMVVVHEHDAVAYEDVIFDGDAVANEGMALNAAAAANDGTPLNFDEGADAGLIADGAAIKIGEFIDNDVAAEDDVVGDICEATSGKVAKSH